MLKIKEAMRRLAPYGPKSQPTINHYCMEGMLPAERQGELWYLPEDFIDDAVAWRKEQITTDDILFGLSGYGKLREDDKKQCARKVSRDTAKYLIGEHRYGRLFAGRFLKPQYVKTVETLMEVIVQEYLDRASLLSVSEAAKRMGLSVFQLKSLIKKGDVRAKQVKNDWYLEESEVKKFLDARNCYVGLNELVTEDILPNISTLYDNENRIHRAMLNGFVLQSELGGILVPWDASGFHGDRRNSYYLPAESKQEFIELLTPVIKQWGFAADRLEWLLEHEYWTEHPRTLEAVKQFSENKVAHGMVALVESIVENMDCEFMEADNEQILNLLDYCIAAPTEIYQSYMSSFIKFVAAKYEVNYSVIPDYRTGKAHKNTVNAMAYGTVDYYTAAYFNFNDEYIKEHDLIRKALDDPKMAYLWLRNIWLYISMWRGSDIIRGIPVIHLKIGRKKLKEKILSGEFGKQEAEELSIRLEMKLQDEKPTPHKTGKERLRVAFPESLREIIGLAYACCLVHTTGKHIEGMDVDVPTYRQFYGEEYVKVFGKKPFSVRRANKAYADALMTLTERSSTKENKMLGYVLASYARGHSSKSGEIAGVTHRYLQYKLDGISDNDVMVRLMDLGPCSFVVDMLLEAAYGEDYKVLPFEEQANLVKATGLTAQGAEVLSQAVLRARRRSRQLAKEIIDAYPTVEGQKAACKNAAMRIIDRSASAKDQGISCLNLALMKPCSNAGCEHCLGCENAILHRSALYSVMQTVREAFEKMAQAKEETSKQVHRHLILHKYIPAVQELLVFNRDRYGMDLVEYKQELLQLITNGGI